MGRRPPRPVNLRGKRGNSASGTRWRRKPAGNMNSQEVIMPRRKNPVLTATPPDLRKRRRRKNIEQPAPPAELSPERDPDRGSPVPEPLAPETPTQDPALAEAEQQLAKKYPAAAIKPGSLRPGAPEGWGGKRVVTIRCVGCGAERTVATSDLFHVSRCADCARAAKKAARQARREVQKEAG